MGQPHLCWRKGVKKSADNKVIPVNCCLITPVLFFQVEEVEVIMSNIHYSVTNLEKLGLCNDKEVRQLVPLLCTVQNILLWNSEEGSLVLHFNPRIWWSGKPSSSCDWEKAWRKLDNMNMNLLLNMWREAGEVGIVQTDPRRLFRLRSSPSSHSQDYLKRQNNCSN